MATWLDLERELRTWRAAGETPTFWWRDDDADAPTAALERLLALADGHGAPLHLAVVPRDVSPELAPLLGQSGEVYVLQHGFAHVNHEPAGAPAAEVGQGRPATLKLRDLREGWRRLRAAQLPNLLPGLTPPWNRISHDTVVQLPRLGYRLLSTGYPRKARKAAPGLHRVNIHVDPIRWKRGPEFRQVEGTLELLTEHLARRRLGVVDPAEPTGLSTHHLQTGEPVWEFLDQLLERLTHRERGRWVRLASILESG
ncbi:MAG: polysaccharide deacetylase [Alphaproteobacteria bacterium]|nr:polysaccharide deacetylase [Alphaproteobacteria bacterium]MCB9929468.1 polysaccharide deacetylase [Alphaproteobacteria bacterium]